jgi:hypothetical protein
LTLPLHGGAEAKQQCRLQANNAVGNVPPVPKPNSTSTPTPSSPGATNSTATPTSFNYGEDKIRGVNL